MYNGYMRTSGRGYSWGWALSAGSPQPKQLRPPRVPGPAPSLLRLPLVPEVTA